MIERLLTHLFSEKGRGRGRVTWRSVVMCGVSFCCLKLYSLDARVARVEGALGITNGNVTVTIPFVRATTNVPPWQARFGEQFDSPQ